MSQTDAELPTSAPLSAAETWAGRKLVVMLCMHRTGSSFTTALFQRLGMSLGPFELIGEADSNKHGHFEAVPFHTLDRELQEITQGFADDMPSSREILEAFCRREGQWKAGVHILPAFYDRGRAMIRELIESGAISGFKDPRALLMWPFWRDVLSGFPGLEVIPLFLTRSPHEVAMSIFMRGKGILAYEDALDVTAVHYQQMLETVQSWNGPHAVVRFDPQVFREDLRRAVEVCGLTWSDGAFAAVYDADCKHHSSAVVSHRAQHLFEQLSGASSGSCDRDNLRRIEQDAAKREARLRQTVMEQQQRLDHVCGENLQYVKVLNQCEQEITRYREDNSRYVATLNDCGGEISRLRTEIQKYALAQQQVGEEIHRLREANRQYVVAHEQMERELYQLRDINMQQATSQAESGAEIARLQEAHRQSTLLAQRLQAESEIRYQELNSHRAELDRYRQMLDGRDQDIRRHLDDLGRYTYQLNEAEHRVVELQHELARQTGALQQELGRQAEASRSEMARQAEAFQIEVARQAEALQQSRQENSRLAAVIAQSREELSQGVAVIEQMRQELEQMRHSEEELRRILTTRDHELRLIKGSRTWRFREMVVSRLRAG